jgi:UDP-2,3-diacylglucosamine pyrophosphatase LpxH
MFTQKTAKSPVLPRHLIRMRAGVVSLAEPAIYFISDTHLGDGTGADRFLYPRQLINLLDRVAAEPEAQLVLLGDFMELWASSMEASMIHHAPIFRAISQISATHPVTYVVGNHDCLPWYYFLQRGIGNVTVTERFTAARGALVALHGHQYDPLNRVVVATAGQVKVPWTRKLVQLVGALERVGGDRAGEAITNIGEALSKAADSLESLMPHLDEAGRQLLKGVLHRTQDVWERESPGERGYPEGENAYEEGARGLMRAGARFVVMGHTHHPLRQQYGGRIYVNTGSWVWDRYGPTYGRFACGRLQLLDGETNEPYVAPARRT